MIYMCSSPVYEYKGVRFEYKPMLGPWPVRKDGELKKRAGAKFWDMFTEFNKLTNKEQQSYRLYGGCERMD